MELKTAEKYFYLIKSLYPDDRHRCRSHTPLRGYMHKRHGYLYRIVPCFEHTTNGGILIPSSSRLMKNTTETFCHVTFCVCSLDLASITFRYSCGHVIAYHEIISFSTELYIVHP